MKLQDHNSCSTFEDLLNEQGYVVYTANGFSMMPLIRQHKDIIEIQKVSGNVRKYDVALYKRGGRYILHRCISINPYVFAGDHNLYKEYDVTDDMIVGVMTRIVRNGKFIYPSNPIYKIYYHLWVDFFPIRAIILRIKAKFRSIIVKKRSRDNTKGF